MKLYSFDIEYTPSNYHEIYMGQKPFPNPPDYDPVVIVEGRNTKKFEPPWWLFEKMPIWHFLDVKCQIWQSYQHILKNFSQEPYKGP